MTMRDQLSRSSQNVASCVGNPVAHALAIAAHRALQLELRLRAESAGISAIEYIRQERTEG